MERKMITKDRAVKKAPRAHLVSTEKPRPVKVKPWNPYAAECPTRLVLDRIGDKWTVLLLGLLESEPVRFNRLKRDVEGITQKMLSQTLKGLERDGLVARRAFATVPLTVEYSVTPLGKTLQASVEVLRRWAEQHIQEVLHAQSKYDDRRSD
jgi:DNA-binding HxlR family transcriptional regulator